MFLELKNSTIGYKTKLIQEVTTSLDKGEICLIIGNNGVGKTTLIKSLLHQIPLLGGELLLNQQNIKTLSYQSIAEQIAVVFSKAQIPMHYTLKDLISLGKYIHYPYYFELNEKDRQEVENIIESLQLGAYKDFPLQKLSDGNLQKAFIGRALAQNSPMIILDEPTTHLDEENKIMILQLLRNLAKDQKKLILFSSHDWRLAKEFADKIWLIKDRRLFSDITEEILMHHEELMNPKFFDINPSFVSPPILAPSLVKEMLQSFLRKNFKKDLSGIKLNFKDGFWEVQHHDSKEICNSFKDISDLITKYH